jgi:hypothetical protein
MWSLTVQELAAVLGVCVATIRRKLVVVPAGVALDAGRTLGQIGARRLPVSDDLRIPAAEALRLAGVESLKETEAAPGNPFRGGRVRRKRAGVGAAVAALVVFCHLPAWRNPLRFNGSAGCAPVVGMVSAGFQGTGGGDMARPAAAIWITHLNWKFF